VNDADAKQRIKDGITFEEVREMMNREFDGQDSTVIADFTKSEVRQHVSNCIDRKKGRVHEKSGDALTVRIALREFGTNG
jgi:hypothetical protein